jgi:hypothetical protein
MTNTARHSGPSPNSAIPPSYPPVDLSIRDILERWVGTDETLRAALTAHASSSNRRAEEERTRQEYYRLETRRVEFEFLREAFRGGIHPSLVPQLFTQDRSGPLNLSPVSPILRSDRPDDRPQYSTSSLPSFNNRHDLPRIDTSNLAHPQQRYLVPHREKYAGPISAPPASMATTSPPPSLFFRHWAPPQHRTQEEIGLRTPREDMDVIPSSSSSHRYHHETTQIPSPSSARKSPPIHNGISPKRSGGSGSAGHTRARSDISKLHDSRHHPYPSSRTKKHDEENTSGLGGTKPNLDREMVMRALREKVAPRKDDEKDTSPSKESSKEIPKEVEREKKMETRDVMALEQLVESHLPQQV